MDPFTRVELNELLAVSAEPVLSIYVPTTEDQPQHYDRGRIRLKNLLGQARARLQESQWHDTDRDALLAEAETLLRDSQFWAQQSGTLALFITPESTRHWRLPLEIAPAVYLGDTFYIRPLLPSLLDDEPFFILALSRNHVRLLEANRHDVAERSLSDTPTSLEEALQWDDPEKQLRARSAKGVQGVPTAFHGHSPKDDELSNLARFVQQIEDGVARALESEDALLVLAGTDTLTASYRQAATRGHVLQQEIEGNPDNQSADALRDAAWPLVHAWRTTQRSTISDRYGAHHAAGRATAEFEQLVRAAHFGQVDLLFLPHSVKPVFGRYIADGAQVEITDQPEDGDLLNLAAIQTLRNGGAVYTDIAPLEDRAAALLRYPVDALPA